MGENGNALGTFKRRCRYNSFTPYVELSLSPPNEKRGHGRRYVLQIDREQNKNAAMTDGYVILVYSEINTKTLRLKYYN